MMTWYDLFTDIFQGGFTGTGAILDCPSTSETTLKDMGKINQHLTTAKQSKAWDELHIAILALYSEIS